MNKQSWPKIKAVVKNGKPMVMADARRAGKGERRFFSTMREAEGWAQVQRIRFKNEGAEAFDGRDLASFGWTVKDAIRFSLEHLRRNSVSISVDAAVRQLIDSKRAAGRAESYLYRASLNLGKLAAHFDSRKISTITAPDIEQFLREAKVAPGTRNTIRRDAVTLWSYAQKAGFAKENVAKAAERATAIDEPPGIFTPEQAAALLAESKDDGLLAFHAIGLFAGLRVSEIHGLDWRDVDLGGGYIHVGAKISKTRSRRLVPILENLRAWLQPIAKLAGAVVGPNLRRRHEAARARAGILQWPKNAMRHSFVSYRLAATGNAAQTALESGHDQAILFTHYRELVRPKDAERFFSIRPAGEAANKVVSITAA
jgi:integrase